MIARLTAPFLIAALAACAPTVQPVDVDRLVVEPVPAIQLPPMKTFASPRPVAPRQSNADIARDFLDLSFQLESGRKLPVFTRFEGTVTIRTRGTVVPGLSADLDRLITRLRREAGVDIRRVTEASPAAITVEAVPRAELQSAVPHAACFVVPRLSGWEEFRANRSAAIVDWTTLKLRERMAVFIPSDVSPQEVRDCLHEEIAQALGPLNDLYRLTDSVFNDDNFHTVLTGFDMLVLRATYAPELSSGMSKAEVAARLPAILARLNPAGQSRPSAPRAATPRDWITQIETALGPKASMQRRRLAARRAVSIAKAQGWGDNRLAFSLFALGRLSLGQDADLALSSFLQAAQIYSARPETQLHQAHVDMQLAAFALSSGQADVARDIVDRHLSVVTRAENAALLASLLMVKAEALDYLGQSAQAAKLSRDSLGWARYGFGFDADVRRRAAEIAALNPAKRGGAS